MTIIGFQVKAPNQQGDKRLTQKQRILNALRMGKRCGTDFLRWEPPIARYSARIMELRQEGYEITTSPCRLHNHESNQVVYELVTADARTLF